MIFKKFNTNFQVVLQGILETAMGLGMSAGPAIGGMLYSVIFFISNPGLYIL